MFLFSIEDFAGEIELSEEEQIKLLEEYENETKLKKQNNKNSVKENPSEKTDTKTDVDRKVDNVETSSSHSSTDGDWEKISDVEK